MAALARSMSIKVVFHITIFLSIVAAHGVTSSTNTGLQQNSLSSYLWENSTDLLAEVWETTFIKGVANGDMDPNFYGAYTMQDAAWCHEISLVWGQVSRNASAPQDLRNYANRSEYSYLNCAEVLFAAFTVNMGGVDLGPAATQYANTVKTATIEYGSQYIMIATYACAKLWSNITADLGTIVNASNPYSLWVYNNTGNSSAIRQATFIDENVGWYDWSLSLSIFRQAMRGEVGLFNLQADSSNMKKHHPVVSLLVTQ
eukprot:c25834_g1_i1 orf=71-844(+)